MNGETEIEVGSAAATVGNNSVKLTAEICGHNFEQTVNYAVEASRKLVYNTNGGTAFDPVWISENTDGFDLPEPSKIGGLHFDGWYSDEGLTNAVTKATYAAGEGDINVYAKWLDIEPPVISLKDGIEELVLLEQAKGGSIAAAVNKTDVVAEDRAMGVLTDGAITISVKEPNGNDFVDWGDWTFDAELYGNYTIKYTATDGTNSVSTERVIRYIKALPSITLSSEKPTSGWVNYEIALPAGASESGTVTVSVVLSGTPVTLTNGKFTPAAAGTLYRQLLRRGRIRYAANETFDIVVIKDEVKPVITVDFTAKSVDLGTEFALPTATATDNVDGAGKRYRNRYVPRHGSNRYGRQVHLRERRRLYRNLHGNRPYGQQGKRLLRIGFRRSREERRLQGRGGRRLSDCRNHCANGCYGDSFHEKNAKTN